MNNELEKILYSCKCWVCGAALKGNETTVCFLIHRGGRKPAIMEDEKQ